MRSEDYCEVSADEPVILPRMVIRKLLQSGDPILQAKNNPITSFKSLKIKQVIENLIDTMYEEDLIGIAAPQIGENVRIFVTHVRNTKARNVGKEDKLRIYINPRIKHTSKEQSILYEGCGSIYEGNIFGPVVRSKEIEVVAIDRHRKKFSLTCDGILARVVLHEYDHLQGIEFTRKVEDEKKLISKEQYIQDIKTSQQQISASIINKIEYKVLS